MDATTTAALVAAAVSLGVSLVGAIVAILTTRWQVRSKTDELTQAQLRDVILKRMEVYPRLWTIVQTMLSDWARLKKPIGEDWARELLTRLIDWHAECGVFLSQEAYLAFNALRETAVEVVRACDHGPQPTEEDLQKALEVMHSIFSQGFKDQWSGKDRPSLATCLKNDVGSYKVPALTVK